MMHGAYSVKLEMKTRVFTIWYKSFRLFACHENVDPQNLYRQLNESVRFSDWKYEILDEDRQKAFLQIFNKCRL